MNHPELLDQSLRDVLFQTPKPPFSWLFYADDIEDLVICTKHEDGTVSRKTLTGEEYLGILMKILWIREDVKDD